MALKPLAQVKFPDLIKFDRESSVNEMIYRMQMDSDWNDMFDGYLHQNASQMVMQFFAFLFEKNATSTNKIIRENFLNQAFSEQAIYDNIKQMRINARQNTEASCEVIGNLSDNYLSESLIIPKYFSLSASDLNGQPTNFEIIEKTDGVYDYLDNVIITPGIYARDNFVVTAYSGRTFEMMVTVTDEALENFKIDIEYTNIIEDSIRVYYRDTGGNLYELRATDSFLISPYIPAYASGTFPNGIPHYIIRYGTSGEADLLFGSEDFGGAFDQSHINGDIVIYGRAGGGSLDNVVVGAIQTNETLDLSGNRVLSVDFINSTAGVGGGDRDGYEEIKQYGPYRYGREDGNIVDKFDSQIALQQQVVKHEIESPMYSEISNTVQLLHAHHRIVPIRDFSSFEFPSVAEDDTLTTYVESFLTNLNLFLNVTGAHDQEITDEMAGEFSKQYDEYGEETYDFVHELDESNPLSGTLVATAWNQVNQIVDQIHWTGNYYSEDFVTSALSTDHAVATSNAFSTMTITAGKNNHLIFTFDNIEYEFDLELPTGLKTAEELVDSLQTSIINEITYIEACNILFFQFRTFDFFVYNETDSENSVGTISLYSPNVGSTSKIEILDNGLNNADPLTDLYTLWGWEETIYRPPLETELVFSSENLYYHDSNEVRFKIDDSLMEVIEETDYTTDWDHVTATVDGTIMEFTLVEEDESLVAQLQENTTIVVEAYDSSDTLLDTMQFLNIEDQEENTPSYPGSIHTIFNDSSDETNYDYLTGTLQLQLIDGTLTTIYEQYFPEIYKIMIRRTDATWTTVDSGEDWETAEWFESGGSWSHEILEYDGPEIVIDVSSEVTAGFAQNGYYEVRIYKMVDSTATLMERLRYSNVDVDAEVNIAHDSILLETDNVSDPTETHYYNPTAKTITIISMDGVVDTDADDYYVQAFTDFDYIKITYQRRSYEYITLDYRPNPYHCDGEAAQYLSVLTASDKRLIGLENILKTFLFVPIAEDITLYVNKNYSLTDAIEATEEAIFTFFGHNNINYDHTIGTAVNQTLIRSVVSKELSNYGIDDIIFNSESTVEAMTDDAIADTYFFFVDYTFVQRLEALETVNTNINGISDLFRLKINAIRKDT